MLLPFLHGEMRDYDAIEYISLPNDELGFASLASLCYGRYTQWIPGAEYTMWPYSYSEQLIAISSQYYLRDIGQWREALHTHTHTFSCCILVSV